uniref:Methylosome subunit pICln n=1 Tax=Dunaliella tertiolecta TaxID=3047 RepID=A0A7S3R6W3_DUNTE
MCAATVPVDRLKALASKFCVQCGVERDSTGIPLAEDDEEKPTIVSNPDVGFYFGDSHDAGMGCLHVTARRVIWVSSSRSDLAFVLRYPQIMMHAVSRDTSSFPKPCIYIQLDDGSEDMQQDEGSEEEEDGGPDADVAAEVRLVPQDSSKIDEIFKLLCDYAALNPDSDAEADGEGDFYFDEAEVYAGLDEATRAQVMAARMQGSLGLEDVHEAEDEYNAQEMGELDGIDDSRFEDDEDEEEGQKPESTANGNAQS